MYLLKYLLIDQHRLYDEKASIKGSIELIEFLSRLRRYVVYF